MCDLFSVLAFGIQCSELLKQRKALCHTLGSQGLIYLESFQTEFLTLSGDLFINGSNVAHQRLGGVRVVVVSRQECELSVSAQNVRAGVVGHGCEVLELCLNLLELCGSPRQLLKSLSVCGVVLRCRTDDSNHLVGVFLLAVCTGEPSDVVPSARLVGAALYDNACSNGGYGLVVDLGLAVFVNVQRTGHGTEFPQTLDFGCEYLELVVHTNVVRDQNGHFTGSETVCCVVGVGEVVLCKHVTHSFKRGQTLLGVEVDSHTAVCIKVTVVLIQEHAVVGGKTDHHVLCLQVGNCSQDIVPGLGNGDIVLCQDVDTNEHHGKALCLGQTVVVHITVGIFNAKHQHSRIVEAADGVGPLGVRCERAILDLLLTNVVCNGVYLKQRGTDRVVDNVTLSKTEVYVRTLTCQDRRKQRAACDQLQVNGSTADVFALFVDTGVRAEFVVDKVSDNLCLVTAGCDPDLQRILFGNNGHGAHAVIVTEEGHDEGLDLVPCSLEHVCLCLYLIVIIGSVCAILLAAADDHVVNFQRLRLCAGQERTQRTDVGLQAFQILSDLVLVGTHVVQQLCDLLQRTYVGGLLTCHVGQTLGNGNTVLLGVIVVKLSGVNDHVDQNVGHHAGEAVIAVLVGGGTGQLNDLQIVVVDDLKDLLNLTDDIAHGTEGHFKSESVGGVCRKIDGILLGLTVCIKLIGCELGGLPCGVVVVLQLFRLREGSAVVVACITLGKSLAVQLQGAADEHTVQHLLSEAGHDIVHTRAVLGGGKGEFDPLTCALPLFTAHGVEHYAGGIGGRGYGIGSVLNRVNGLGGHVVHVLSLKLDLILTGGKVAKLCGQVRDVILVGYNILCRIQRDGLDDHRLVLTLNGQLVLACFQVELILTGIVTGRVTQAVLDPSGSLYSGGTQLVVLNVVSEEADLVRIHELGACHRPYLGEFNRCVHVVLGLVLAEDVLLDLLLDGKAGNKTCSLSVLDKRIQRALDVSRKIAFGHCSNVRHTINRANGIQTQLILARPVLGQRQITRLTEGHLIIDFEYALDGSCLALYGEVLDLDRVLCAVRHVDDPGNLTFRRGEKTLGYAVLVLVRGTNVTGSLVLLGRNKAGKRVDRNGLSSLVVALARILFRVFTIRNRVQKLFDLCQCVLCFLGRNRFLIVIRSKGCHGSATNQEGQSQNQRQKLSKFRFSHKISSYQDFRELPI